MIEVLVIAADGTQWIEQQNPPAIADMNTSEH